MTGWRYRQDRAAGWQAVEVLVWTEHGATVIATEDGELPRDRPSMVRLFRLSRRDDSEAQVPA